MGLVSAANTKKMIVIDDISEIQLHSVQQRGVPNEERILFQVLEDCELGVFGVLLGYRKDTGAIIPMRDHFVWFGERKATAGDWIFLYSGPGEYREMTMADRPGTLHICHWGREETILHDPRVSAVLIKIGEVAISVPPPPPKGLPQLGRSPGGATDLFSEPVKKTTG
jgi:hypothetical protein